jgi:bifunctional non-homologous end joining protein LigD
MQQGKRGTPIVYYVFDLLESRRAARRPAARGAAQAAREAARHAEQDVALSETFDDGEALLEAAKQQASRGSWPSALGSQYLPGSAHARLAEDQGPRPAGVRDRRLHAGRAARGTLGSLVLARTRAASSSTSGNVGTGFNDREIDAARQAAPLERETPPFARCRRCRGPQGRRRLGRAEARRRGRVREWTHDGTCARRRTRAARGQGADGGAPRASRSRAEIRKGKRVLKLSNLDKLFWPDEGITKGDLLAYYRASRRCSSRTSRTGRSR